MKKIQYRVLKTLVLAFLVGGMTGIVLADPPTPADPAHPKKTHDRPTSTTTTTTHVTQSATTTHAAPAGAPRPPEVTHDDHARTADAPRPDAGRPDFHDNQHDDHHFDHDNGRREVHYDHDSRGWYDENHHRHDFVVYRGHRGFWNYENGQPVFVSIDVPLPFSINIHL